MSYGLLDYLTAEQASKRLESSFGIKLSEADLFSYCEQNKCNLYIKLSGASGYDGVTGEERYGVGYQRILNADCLSAGSAEPELVLLGDVRASYDPEDTILIHQEWRIRMSAGAIRPVIAREDLDELGGALSKVPDKVSVAHELVIAELLELVLKDPKVNQTTLVKNWSDKYKTVRGVGESSLNKLLARANSKKAETQKPPGSA